jgi:hypothetical protein
MCTKRTVFKSFLNCFNSYVRLTFGENSFMLFIDATMPTAVRRPTPLRPANSNEPPGIVNTRSHRTIASRISRNMNTSVSRCSARYRTMARSMNGIRSLRVKRVSLRPADGRTRRRVLSVTHDTKYASRQMLDVTRDVCCTMNVFVPRSELSAFDDQSVLNVFSMI